MIALFFMYPSFGGGSTSFTVHLFEGMRRAGLNPKIFRVKIWGEVKERKFSKYEGVTYRNIDVSEAFNIVKTHPSLMTAPAHSKNLPYPTLINDLMKKGMRIVIHDPNEFKVYDHLNPSIQKPFCIRPTMQQFFKDAIFIPHPYVRHFDTIEYQDTERELRAISVARVSFVKRTHIILEANRCFCPEGQIVLRGAENRLYTKHVISKKFPDWVPKDLGFSMTWGASAIECARAKYAVDLTYFPNDGGGSQYSFMEAWDAGTVNILHKDWLRYEGEMVDKKNCLAINEAVDLADTLTLRRDIGHIVNAGYNSLRQHDAVDVARIYADELNK